IALLVNISAKIVDCDILAGNFFMFLSPAMIHSCILSVASCITNEEQMSTNIHVVPFKFFTFCAILLFGTNDFFTFIHILSTDIYQIPYYYRQESTKSDDENKANDGDPSSNETEPSNGKTDINDTPMDESQVTRSLIYNIDFITLIILSTLLQHVKPMMKDKNFKNIIKCPRNIDVGNWITCLQNLFAKCSFIASGKHIICMCFMMALGYFSIMSVDWIIITLMSNYDFHVS
ncbi:hypothetical protein ACJX0J_020184, partial [Zea mays]